MFSSTIALQKYVPAGLKRTMCWRFMSLNSELLKCEGKGHFISNDHHLLKTTKYLSLTRQMAGHAKWQNVKHIKAEKDRQKTMLCNKYSRLIALAVREKGPDPKVNIKLANLLEEARRQNVPLSSLEGALKKGSNKKIKAGSMEIFAPGGPYLIVEYETDNISTIRHDLKTICKKHGASVVGGEGKWRAVYEQKGFLKVTRQKNGEAINEGKSLDDAILAGAEEVHTILDENEENILEFTCAPDDLLQVKKELEQEYEIEEAYIGYKPTTTVELPEEAIAINEKLLEDIGNLQEVVRIYENIK
ncbi:probable transcriptional regulatory protein PERMA_0079 [Uloborus diversus]|uniref:probable transcriptional regulatory protein PERMA_0079 n=1 Tax=Uloborus diversus TaxID=327109 RepID=UPI00240946E6|nr:probable transcriptional regulatory protein PERMA_0079 [Uloborus diversus]